MSNEAVAMVKSGARKRTVLLVSLNRFEDPYAVFPLGLAYLQNALEEAGHRVHVHDCLTARESLADCLERLRPEVVGLSVRNIDNVQMEAPLSFVQPVREAVALVRGILPQATVVVGGAGFSIFPEQLLKHSGADFGVQGEGEGVFVALLEALDQPGHPCIPGLLHLREGEVHSSVPAHPEECRLSLPELDPDWVGAYLERGSILNLQTQRGCALKCCFCTYPVIEGRCYRRREPEEIVADLRKLHGLGARYVFFVDSVFNTSRGHVEGVCEAILQSGLKIDWGCFMSPRAVSLDLLALMKRAGLKHIEFGSDSFCDPVLRRYGKHFRFEEVLASSENAHRAGINYAHFLICGGPGETGETLEESFRNSAALPEAVIFAFVGMRVYPHTPVWEELTASGELAEGTDLLQPWFYLSPAFTREGIAGQLSRQAARDPRWIVGALPPEFHAISARLRARKVQGPLWEYLTLMRRLST